jgi:hypothetical protein
VFAEAVVRVVSRKVTARYGFEILGGHVSGGGWGWLTRRDSLIVDHLYGVEVVVVDANGAVRTVVATREANDPNRDLWWAHTGGGGGNFGVVTRYLFRSPGVTSTDPRKLLREPPAQVLLFTRTPTSAIRRTTRRRSAGRRSITRTLIRDCRRSRSTIRGTSSSTASRWNSRPDARNTA